METVASFRSLGIVSIPVNLSLDELREKREKILFVIPYCAKSIDCPAGRASTKCIKGCSKCAVSKLISKLEKSGIDYCIVVKDVKLLNFLKKNRGRYHYIIGNACDILLRKYAKYAHEKMGLSGYVVGLLGETCKTDEEFEFAETRERKRGQTLINERAVDVILDALT